VDLLRQLSNPPPSFTKLLDRMASRTIEDLPSRVWIDVEAVVVRQRQRRLPCDEIAALAAEYRTGATVRELTCSYGICRTTVLAHLHRTGVATRPNVTKLTDVDRGAIVELYESGVSLAKIGAIYSVDAKTIERVLMQAAVPRRPRRGRPAAGP
jgi:hypothetical protein